MDCMNEIITARNTEDGTVGLYPRWMVGHPLVGKYLEEVEHGAKPSVPLDDLVREKFDLPEREEPQPETDLKRKKTNV